MGVIALGKDALGVGTLGAGGGPGPWWDPRGEGLCVYQAQKPKGAVSFLASLTDLSGNGNPAGDPGGINTPAWDAVNGWKPDGIQTYLTTTFVPQLDQSQSLIVQYTNALTVDGFLAGCRGGANRTLGLTPSHSLLPGVRYFNGALENAVPVLLAGNLAVSGAFGYRNGIVDTPAMAGWTGGAPELWIGCRNNVGVPDRFMEGYVQALAIYHCTLTAPQVFAVWARMAAL